MSTERSAELILDANRLTLMDGVPAVVGRSSDSDLVIPSGSVSRHHAEFVLRDGRVLVRDLNSTRGTFAGQERVTTQPVEVTATSDVRLGDLVDSPVVRVQFATATNQRRPPLLAAGAVAVLALLVLAARLLWPDPKPGFDARRVLVTTNIGTQERQAVGILVDGPSGLVLAAVPDGAVETPSYRVEVHGKEAKLVFSAAPVAGDAGVVLLALVGWDSSSEVDYLRDLHQVEFEAAPSDGRIEVIGPGDLLSADDPARVTINRVGSRLNSPDWRWALQATPVIHVGAVAGFATSACSGGSSTQMTFRSVADLEQSAERITKDTSVLVGRSPTVQMIAPAGPPLVPLEPESGPQLEACVP